MSTRGHSFVQAFGRRLRLVFVVCAIELAAASLASASGSQKQVLVLYSTRRDAQIAVVGERELPRMLEAGLGGNIDHYSEYIDPARFSEPEYDAGLRDFLRLKYVDHEFDVIVGMGDDAVKFISSHRKDLFTNVPVAFYTASPATRRPPNSAGIVVGLDLHSTVGMMLALQPGLRHIFVVTGAEDGDRRYEGVTRAQLRPFEARVELVYLSGLSTTNLQARLRALPERSAVYYVLVNKDGDGEYFHPLDYLERVVDAANAPTYSWVDSTMGRGVVGGNLKSLERQVWAVGQVALSVLKGARADDIPTSSPDLNVNEVDFRQLRRWGISEARLPPGTQVMFREPSAWDRYKEYILASVAVLLGQTMLIIALLVQRTRRRKAEGEARGSQAALQTSLVRIRDLGGRLLNAQEAERARIARELHDDIAQQLALLTIDLELLDRDKPSGEALHRAHEIAKSVHDLSHRLHPAKLRLVGLVAALRGLEHELAQSDIPVTFTHQNVPPAIAPDLMLCIFRIVQEAVQNALKYSKGRHVSVHLSGSPEGLELTVRDDGVGFDLRRVWGSGLGLISMGERLEAMGGTLQIRSSPGQGTIVEAKVPLSAVNTETIAV
jgi:signal transduction histidine kinase